MIRDVFDQPHQASVMLFFGLVGGLGYELVRLFVRSDGRLGTVLRDLFSLLLLQICLFVGLLLSTRGEVRLYGLVLFFSGILLVRWAFRPLFTEILQKICKKLFPSNG
jgi:hypothetical protein